MKEVRPKQKLERSGGISLGEDIPTGLGVASTKPQRTEGSLASPSRENKVVQYNWNDGKGN